MTSNLSTRQRLLPRRVRRNLPIAPLPDSPLRYVTDNVRDAEALARTVDSPVFLRVQSQDGMRTPLSPATGVVSSQTLERSERSGSFEGLDVPDVSDVSDSLV